MKRAWTLFVLATFALSAGIPEAAPRKAPRGWADDNVVEASHHSVARQWNDVLIDAIRIDIPKPTVHSRNLYHMSVAMWDAWAAYEPSAIGVLVNEKHFPDDVAAARDEAISHAAYVVLKHRYRFGPGEIPSQQSFDDLMDALGYDRTDTSTVGDSPAALGNRIGQAVIDYGLSDGANEGPLLDYVDDTGYFPWNRSLVFELPGAGMFYPNKWQPLAFDYLILQNGIVIGAAVQEFLGPNWGKVAPFGMRPADQAFPWVYFDPGMPPQLGGVSDAEFKANAVQLIEMQSKLDPALPETLDIGPGALHNNPLGTQDGVGRPLNPYTGEPYEPNVVKLGDYGRVLAEFWADGPHSETPPGHWNTLLNYVTDHPQFERKLRGEGQVLDPLEWDVKAYLAINGAVHDAAIAAWGCKGHYDYSRPISHIRHMAEKGQSSDPSDVDTYHPDGLPLVPGLIEVITLETTAAGERHEHLAGREGEIAVLGWNGIPDDPETETGGVGWIRALMWLPYQRDTFVTPPFAGYVSGHSTFSRAAAEVMTGLTGSEFFPGGMGTFVAHQDEYLEFEHGPSETVVLQWATYQDAADEAGVSRLWGGIHPKADDFPGRIMGAEIGMTAWAKAQEYYGGGKVYVCHAPPGNPNNAHTIEISENALQAHLGHGDAFGACEDDPPDDDTGGEAIVDSFDDRPSRFLRVSARSNGKAGNDARGRLIELLGQQTDPGARFDIVRELAGKIDAKLNPLLIEHLKDIAVEAQSAGLPALVERSDRLRGTLE